MLSHSRLHMTRATRTQRQPIAAQVDVRQQELEQDLRLARDLQQGLMLETVPRIPGWEISAVSLPARELGGDLYDFLAPQPGQQGIMIGDVSGKGLPAALRMAVARTVFRSEARREGLAPGTTLAAVNNTLLEEMPHGMVTMLYALINTLTGEIVFANAGHNYPLLIADTIVEIEATGLPLGVAELDHYTEHRLTLEYGQTAVFYTDGVVEATDNFEELYGFSRLQELLESVGHLKPRALMARILAEVRTWTRGRPPVDDITMVVLRRRLRDVVDEMRSIVADIIGVQTATEWWQSLELEPMRELNDSATILRAVTEIVSQQFGRGIAREVQGQLRPVIEEYRLISPATMREAQGEQP